MCARAGARKTGLGMEHGIARKNISNHFSKDEQRHRKNLSKQLSNDEQRHRKNLIKLPMPELHYSGIETILSST